MKHVRIVGLSMSVAILYCEKLYERSCQISPLRDVLLGTQDSRCKFIYGICKDK